MSAPPCRPHADPTQAPPVGRPLVPGGCGHPTEPGAGQSLLLSVLCSLGTWRAQGKLTLPRANFHTLQNVFYAQTLKHFLKPRGGRGQEEA